MGTKKKSLVWGALFLVLLLVGSLVIWKPTVVFKPQPALLTESVEGSGNYWQTASPEDLGLKAADLKKAVAEAAELHNFFALLVIKDGKLVVERYFGNAESDRLFHLRSITKNFTSALTGIGINEGLLENVQKPIRSYFPDLVDEEKESIQVTHLLNMSLGLEWDEGTEVYPLVRNKVKQPIQYLLKKKVTDPAGEKMNYNSLATHVLARILERESGKRLEDLAETKLFRPLGITEYEWEKDPEDHAWGGYGLQLRARDLAKFGQMYLNEGLWESQPGGKQQVVPAKWVQESSKLQIEVGVPGGGYSNQWWYTDLEVYDQPFYFGRGYGGQALVIIPDKNMVVVAFQNHNVPPNQDRDQWNALVEKVFPPIYEAAR